jgi:hypothetical protein
LGLGTVVTSALFVGATVAAVLYLTVTKRALVSTSYKI